MPVTSDSVRGSGNPIAPGGPTTNPGREPFAPCRRNPKPAQICRDPADAGLPRGQTPAQLAGAAASVANGLLSFRNNALHADWSKVDVATVQSCHALVERLLLEHYS